MTLSHWPEQLKDRVHYLKGVGLAVGVKYQKLSGDFGPLTYFQYESQVGMSTSYLDTWVWGRNLN